MIDCSGFPHPLRLELGSAVYTGRHFYCSKAVCQFSRARQFAVAYWSTLDLLQLRACKQLAHPCRPHGLDTVCSAVRFNESLTIYILTATAVGSIR